MLNKLGRKRITVVVGPRKPRVVEEAEAMISIVHTKTDDTAYLSVRVPKPRPAGLVGRFDIQVGSLEDLLIDPIPGDYIPPVVKEQKP